MEPTLFFYQLKSIPMKKNMGKTDRIVRILIAAVVVGLFGAKIITGLLATVLLVLAAVFVLTSFVSFCPLYTLVGLNTCPVEER